MTEEYCVYMAEPDQSFKRKVKRFFSSVVEPGISFTFSEPETKEEIEAVYRLIKPDIVFIDALYLMEGGERIRRMLRSRKNKYQLIVVISDNHANEVKNFLEEIDRKVHPYLSGTVPTDNFSNELLGILLSFFLLKTRM